MLTIALTIVLILLAVKLVSIALAAAWGLLKIIVGILLFPFICLIALLEGLLLIAIPVLAVIGLVTVLGWKGVGVEG